MNEMEIAVLLVGAVALLVTGIEVAYQKHTTGAVDMKAAMRWFRRTLYASALLLAGMAGYTLLSDSRTNAVIEDAQAGAEAAKQHDFDTAIRLYSKAINANIDDPALLADIYHARALAHLQQKQFDEAAQDFGEALKRKPDDPVAYWGLGISHSRAGDDEAALQAFDHVIALNQNPEEILPDSFIERGGIYMNRGQYDSAVQDFDEALRLRPNDAMTLGGRGEVQFYAGRFHEAENDLRAAGDQDAKMAYYPLWLDMAVSRQEKDGQAELAERSGKLDLKAWPGPVIQFYLGKSSADELRAAANSDDAKTQHDQQCEASFYLGEHALLTGDKTEARRLLGEASDNCDRNFVEYGGAKAELSRLDQ